jgi:hypothetical protein
MVACHVTICQRWRWHLRLAAGIEPERRSPMALYEVRTYTVRPDKMAEAMKLYQEEGFPALQKGGAGQEVGRLF